MARFCFYLGLFLMVLPFGITGLELAYAHLTHATGEAAMAAGFWGFMVGIITFIPGLIMALIGGFFMLFDR